MAGLSHDRPGWYRDPDDPRKLRYWDGTAWTGRSRRKPPWALRAEPFDLRDGDRSVEGPVHPWELRAPAYSAAAKERLAFRLRPQLHSLHRRGLGGGAAGSSWGGRPVVPSRLGPARRPLLAFVSLLLVALAVVVSSVAVISPYESRQEAARVAVSDFAVLASKDCEVTLPKYRQVLASGTDGPLVVAAARQVDLLRRRLASIPAGELVSATVAQWLQAWRHFTADQRRFAAIVGPAGRPSAAARAVRRDAHKWAAFADQLSANLEATPCRLEPTSSS